MVFETRLLVCWYNLKVFSWHECLNMIKQLLLDSSLTAYSLLLWNSRSTYVVDSITHDLKVMGVYSQTQVL